MRETKQWNVDKLRLLTSTLALQLLLVAPVLAQDVNLQLAPELSKSKGLWGTTISVGTGCLQPRKNATVTQYEFLTDGKVVATSPPNPPQRQCTFSAGFGISVDTTMIHFDPLPIKMDENVGSHNITMMLHYSDGTVSSSDTPSVFTIEPENPISHTLFTAPPKPGQIEFRPGQIELPPLHTRRSM